MKENKYCVNCNRILNDNGECDFCKTIEQKNRTKRSLKLSVLIIKNVLLYIMGSCAIIQSFNYFPKKTGFIAFFFGLSLYPIIYKFAFNHLLKMNIKKRNKILVQLLTPITLFLIFCFAPDMSYIKIDEKKDKVIKTSYEIAKDKIEEKLEMHSLVSINENDEGKYDVFLEIQNERFPDLYACISSSQIFVEPFFVNKQF